MGRRVELEAVRTGGEVKPFKAHPKVRSQAEVPTSRKTTGAVKQAIPHVRVGQALAPEDVVAGAPPPVFETERGCNCVIVVSINGERFRTTCDSGASRDVIRKSFAATLRTNKKTKSATLGPRPMSGR